MTLQDFRAPSCQSLSLYDKASLKQKETGVVCLSQAVMLEEETAPLQDVPMNALKAFVHLFNVRWSMKTTARYDSQSGSIDDDRFVSRVSGIKCFSTEVTFRK